jgi:hypothetical protein
MLRASSSRTRGTRYRALAAALVTLAASFAATAEAAAPPLVTRTLVLRRTSSGPTSFQLNVSVLADSRGTFIGAMGARADRGRVTSATAVTASTTRRWDNSTVETGPFRFTACDVGVCHGNQIEGYHGLGSAYRDQGIEDTGALTHVFVAMVGKDAAYEFTGKGWTVQVLRFGFRYLDGGDTSADFAHFGAVGVEAYSDGSLIGGRHGSLAMGVPPCSLTGTGLVFRGVGTVTLDGGVRPESFTCPTSRILPASYATRATTWRLHGTVAGDATGMDTRLFVVDLPARLP